MTFTAAARNAPFIKETISEIGIKTCQIFEKLTSQSSSTDHEDLANLLHEVHSLWCRMSMEMSKKKCGKSSGKIGGKGEQRVESNKKNLKGYKYISVNFEQSTARKHDNNRAFSQIFFRLSVIASNIYNSGEVEE